MEVLKLLKVELKIKVMRSLLFLIVVHFTSFAQTDNTSKYVNLPLTPNASSMVKEATLPVGLYSGTAQYSIPLYTVQGLNLSVPITLNYSTNGLSVEEMPSWAGSGWSLDAGGVITRKVKGFPDDRYADEPPVIDPTCLTVPNCQILETNIHDLEYDHFNFNFLGNSGTFIIVGGTPKLIENNGFTVELVMVGFEYTEFIITDNSGIRYFFGKSYNGSLHPIESSQFDSLGELIKTAWYLSKIEHWSGEKIFFQYSGGSFQPTYNVGFVQKRSRQLQSDDACSNCTVSSPNWTPIGPMESSVFRYNPIYLQSITCDNSYDKVDFTRTNNKLSSIIGKTKKVDFEISTNLHRLYLKKVLFQSLDNTVGDVYKFSYFDETDVPARNTLKRDRWGLYNGKNNQNLITGDHASDINFAKNGALSQITLPTGATTFLDYESNQNSALSCISNVQVPAYASEETSWTFGGQGGTNQLTEYQFSIPFSQEVTFVLQQEYYPNPSPPLNGQLAGKAFFSIVFPNYTVHSFPQPNFDNGQRELTLTLEPGNYTFNLIVKSSYYRARFRINYCNQMGEIPVNFGGIRIKTVKTYDGGYVVNSKSYNYGPGQMATPQRSSTFYDSAAESLCFMVLPDGATLIIPTYCPYQIESSTGTLSQIGAAGLAFYNIVTENVMDGAAVKSSITHYFESSPYKSIHAPMLNCDLPDSATTEYYGKPYELETNFYRILENNSRQLIKKVEYEYVNDLNGIMSYPSYNRDIKKNGVVVWYQTQLEGESCVVTYQHLLKTKYRLARYMNMRYWQKLVSEKSYEYFYSGNATSPSNTIYNLKKYYYDNSLHKQVTRIESFNSDHISGTLTKKETIKYSYADDILDVNSLYGGALSNDYFITASQKMNFLAKHIINQPLQIEKIDNEGNHLETERFQYKIFTSTINNFELPLLEKISTLKGEHAITILCLTKSYLVSSIQEI